MTAVALPSAGPKAAPIIGAGAQKNGSGLPVPRFVSLKAGRVNVRVGPGEDYKIAWVFTRPGLPIEVIQEYDTWRRIRDSDGTEGWVYHSLLSGKRTGMVIAKNPDELVPIYEKPDVESAVTAQLERGVVGTVKRCGGEGWCYVNGRGFEGWIQQVRLWGVYPNEKVD